MSRSGTRISRPSAPCGCSRPPPATGTTSGRRTIASARACKQDPDNELSSSRFAAGLNRAPAFAWKTHVDARYEGYRLGIKVDAAGDDPAQRADELASEVLRNLRLAGLLA